MLSKNLIQALAKSTPCTVEQLDAAAKQAERASAPRAPRAERAELRKTTREERETRREKLKVKLAESNAKLRAARDAFVEARLAREAERTVATEASATPEPEPTNEPESKAEIPAPRDDAHADGDEAPKSERAPTDR